MPKIGLYRFSAKRLQNLMKCSFFLRRVKIKIKKQKFEILNLPGSKDQFAYQFENSRSQSKKIKQFFVFEK